MTLLLTQQATGAAQLVPMLAWLAVFGVAIYFMMIRPQKKEQAKHDAMMADLAVGDYVLTTAGFYGEIIDIADDTVIVEFGSNKNCRIPMKKTAISEVEKAGAE
ncbi:MAG TPA: preprotein translocase subunit YajC [Lachnospiraceae bacterium]|nr:preprotein translocase subunit YajC [Lachnospiraceae bacterium]